MSKALFTALAATALLTGCNQGPPVPEKTAQQLMATEVQPTAQIFWDSVQFVSDETGDHDIFPKTDAEWKRTQDAAAKMGELAELLKTPGYAEERGADWVQIATSLGEIAKRAEQAAIDRDTDKIFEVGGVMYNVCSACHLAYPATTGAEAEEAAQAT